MQVPIGPKHRELFQLNSEYFQREFKLENEDVKQPQRDRVQDLIVSHHRHAEYLKLASLPGAWWTFERQLWESRDCSEHTRFIAFETNYSVLMHGMPFLPGSNGSRRRFGIRGRWHDGAHSTLAKILWINAGDFINKRCFTTKQWANWTAIWWDFTSPLNEVTFQVFLKSGKFLKRGKPDVPVAITLQIGRDSCPALTTAMKHCVPSYVKCPVKRRAAFLKAAYSANGTGDRKFMIVDSHQYLSAGGASMGLILGVLRKR